MIEDAQKNLDEDTSTKIKPKKKRRINHRPTLKV